MKILTSFIVILLVGLCRAAPTSNEDDDNVVITKDFYADELVKYTGKHNIVNLLLPLNSLNFDENDSSESDSKSNEVDTDLTIFFVEADEDADGNRIDQGLYVLHRGQAKKLLDHGRDAAASGDDSKLVFFGAKDGIYVYKQNDNSAEKYGNVDDSIIGIAKEKTGDVIYILTEDRNVYKVSEEGKKKEILDDIVKAKQIVIDYSNNIYFYSDDKVVYVRTANGVKKIEGLPENPASVTLVKPPFILEEGVMLVVDTSVFIIYPNGTFEGSGFELKPKTRPSAYAPEGALIQYYAYNKKIYEYNVLMLVLGSILDELKNYLKEKTDEIQTISSKPKHSFRNRA